MSEQSSPRPHLSSNRRFEAWARLVLRFRWLVMLGCLLLSAFMWRHANDGLRVDTSFDTFLPRGSPASLALSQLHRDFGSDRTYQILIEGDVFSTPFLQRLGNLHADLEALQERAPSPVPGGVRVDERGAEVGWGEGPVRRVHSLINAGVLLRRPDGVVFESFRQAPRAAAELPAWRAEVLASDDLVGRVVDETGRFAVVTLELTPARGADLRAIHKSLQEVVHLYAEQDFLATVGGPLAVALAVHAGVIADQEFLLSAEAVAFLLLMWFVFRHPIGVFGPLLVVAQAALYMFGWMAMVGTPLTMVSAVLGALVLCMGIGFSVHLQSVYRRTRRAGWGNRQAIERAVGMAGLPILFTTLTSCAAMLSFNLARMQPIRQLGLAGATGVFFAGLFTLTFIPAWLSLNPTSWLGARPPGAQPRVTDRALAACDRLTRHAPVRRYLVLGLGVALLGVFAWGASAVRYQHDPVAWLPHDLPLVRATQVLSDQVGGSSSVSLLLTPRDGSSVSEPRLLQASARSVERALAFRDPQTESPLVRGAHGLEDLNRAALSVLDVSAVDAATRARGGNDDLLTFWELISPETLHRFVTLDRARSRVELRLGWGDSDTYGAFARALQTIVAEELSPLAHVQIAGAADSTFEVARSLLSDLMRSFSTALAVITLVLILLLRNVRLGLVAAAMSVWPVLGMFGFMGLTGQAIDIQSILLAPLAAGFAIDNTVHFLHYFRLHYRRHRDVDAALTYAFEQKGRAILGSSGALLVGFGVLLLGYMSSTRTFGLLAVVVTCLALLANLLLLPALLRTVFKPRPRVDDPERASSYDMTFSEFF